MKYFIKIVRFLLKTYQEFVIKLTAMKMADMPFKDDGYKYTVFSGFSLQWTTDKSK